MSSYLLCGAYKDLTCKLRVCRGRIGIEFQTEQGEAEDSMYFSLNPMQAKTFVESLQNMVLRTPIQDIKNPDTLGHLEVNISIEEEVETKKYHREEPVA
jgi:hypothetical protein